jgi:RNA polymerase sigma-70 factor (ECF subfamily)
LLDVLQPVVFRWVRPIVGQPFDAEDATQQTLLQVLKSIKIFEPARCRGWALAWVRKLARNEAIAVLRRRGRFGHLAYDLASGLADDEPAPADLSIKRERIAAFGECLDGLPHGFRLPIVLFHYHDKTHEEIAAEGIPGIETAVASRQRLSRGLKKIRDCMELSSSGDEP